MVLTQKQKEQASSFDFGELPFQLKMEMVILYKTTGKYPIPGLDKGRRRNIRRFAASYKLSDDEELWHFNIKGWGEC